MTDMASTRRKGLSMLVDRRLQRPATWFDRLVLGNVAMAAGLVAMPLLVIVGYLLDR